MTRSIFDPNSGETERSGSSFSGPDADQISQLPPDIVDGKVEPQELADHGEEDITTADDNVKDMERAMAPAPQADNQSTEA